LRPRLTPGRGGEPSNAPSAVRGRRPRRRSDRGALLPSRAGSLFTFMGVSGFTRSSSFLCLAGLTAARRRSGAWRLPTPARTRCWGPVPVAALASRSSPRRPRLVLSWVRRCHVRRMDPQANGGQPSPYRALPAAFTLHFSARFCSQRARRAAREGDCARATLVGWRCHRRSLCCSPSGLITSGSSDGPDRLRGDARPPVEPAGRRLR
jgi:hypothetical protein